MLPPSPPAPCPANAAPAGNRSRCSAPCSAAWPATWRCSTAPRGRPHCRGICPRFPDFLAASRFRPRFEAKGRFNAWLAPIPTWLILRPDAAMLGLSALARQG
ncbi:glucokinase [Dankookia sp. P2]|uniref:glucokinase n=1 Tax=Dankookia sp. P2 TaxID=3423955 RepID=UPI003D66BE08